MSWVGSFLVCLGFRAAADRQSHAGGARAQVGGRHGGMNDAPLNTKVRVASYLTVTVTEIKNNWSLLIPNEKRSL